MRSDSIVPGPGYFVKLNQDGKLVLSSLGPTSGSARIRIAAGREIPPASPGGEDEDARDDIPASFAVEQNYPNPFNPSTVIRYQLPVASFVTLRVFNILGEEVATLVNETQDPGYRSVTIDAGTLPSGMYCYRIVAGPFNESRKMLLVK